MRHNSRRNPLPGAWSNASFRVAAPWHVGALAIIFGCAVAVRLYNLSSPLWLDEIYTYGLTRQDFFTVIRNSWTDPHPPLYYVLQWSLATLLDGLSVVELRATSVIAGVLLLGVIWAIVRSVTDGVTALISVLLMATSPSLVYFSQEARAYALLCFLAVLSIWLTLQILRDDASPWLWAGWMMVTILGLYTGYPYLMIAGVQIAFLGVFQYRRVGWWLAVLLVIGTVLTLSGFLRSSLTNLGKDATQSAALQFWLMLQTLFAGEPLRYGVSIAHALWPWFVVGLCGGACVWVGQRQSRQLAFLVAQVGVPLVFFFGVAPLFGLFLRPYDSKQFLVLLPALFVLIALGIAALRQWLGGRAGIAIAVALGVFLTLLNMIGLSAYWATPKSPEGLAVLRLQEQLQPGESVVSLHYSVEFSLWLYALDAPIYRTPEPAGSTYRYRLTTSEHIFDGAPIASAARTTEDIRADQPFWVIVHTDVRREPLHALTVGCTVNRNEMFMIWSGGFELMYVVCPAE